VLHRDHQKAPVLHAGQHWRKSHAIHSNSQELEYSLKNSGEHPRPGTVEKGCTIHGLKKEKKEPYLPVVTADHTPEVWSKRVGDSVQRRLKHRKPPVKSKGLLQCTPSSDD